MAALAACQALGVSALTMRRGAAWLRAAAAPLRTHPHAGWSGVSERLEGDEPARAGKRAAFADPAGGAHRRRQGEGAGLRARGSAAGGEGAGGRHLRPDRAAAGGSVFQGRPLRVRFHARRGRGHARAASPRAARPSCFRPEPLPSINSPDTNNAETPSGISSINFANRHEAPHPPRQTPSRDQGNFQAPERRHRKPQTTRRGDGQRRRDGSG